MKVVINRLKVAQIVEEPLSMAGFVSVEFDFGNGQVFEVLPKDGSLVVSLVGKNFTIHAEPPVSGVVLTARGKLTMHSSE